MTPAQQPDDLDQQIVSMISRYAPEMEGKILRITILELCQHIQKMGDEYRSRPAPAPGGSECEAAVNIKYCRHVIEAEGRGERAATLKAIGEDARILNEWGYPAAAAILSNEKERERVLKSLRRQQAGEQE